VDTRTFLRVKSLVLSPLIRTRQTRHLWDKPLIPLGRSMSGSPKNPTWNPTKSDQKPDNQPPSGRRRYTLLTTLTLLRISRRPPFGSTRRSIPGGGIRPDSWGRSSPRPRVIVSNKGGFHAAVIHFND